MQASNAELLVEIHKGKLSPRLRQTYELAILGTPGVVMAKTLGVSLKSVKAYLTVIYCLLGAKGLRDLQGQIVAAALGANEDETG